jgi:hypothetical protein
MAGRRAGNPDCRDALLITSDDGWADNIRYAAPLLKARDMPAIIFVAGQAVQADATAWWQEEVYAAIRSGSLSVLEWARIMGPSSEGTADHSVDVVTRLALMDAEARENILVTLPRSPCHARIHRWMAGDHPRKRQTSTASPAEPGELPR